MRFGRTIAALAFCGLSGLAMQAKAAPAAGVIRPDAVQAAAPAHVEPVYWAWRGGVRVWIGPRPYYRYGYYHRPPYYWRGRGYWHRGWYHGGWRYW
jgi:hypothetical protein